jgi:hypothetical protein
MRIEQVRGGEGDQNRRSGDEHVRFRVGHRAEQHMMMAGLAQHLIEVTAGLVDLHRLR